MTVLFHDVHEKTEVNMTIKRPTESTCDEVMCADDTICIATDTRQMNSFLKEIEQLGKQYGLTLNYTKCELLTTETNPNIHFTSGTKVPRKTEVTYLGCEINLNGDNKKELSKRIGNTMQTLKRLDLYWRHSNCPTRTKLIAADAVIRAKLMYGIESAQLTTFVDRSNTNNKHGRGNNTTKTQQTTQKATRHTYNKQTIRKQQPLHNKKRDMSGL